MHQSFFSPLGISLVLALTLPLAACSGTDPDKEDSDTASETDTDSEDTGTLLEDDTGTEPEDDNDIGDPVGDPIAIDHPTIAQTVEDNIVRHMNGLEASIEFLEDSGAVNNLVDLLFGDDDDDGDDGNGTEEAEDEPIDIDLSELRDGLVEVMAERLLVESTSTVAEDGLSIFYATSPELLCAEEEEENETADDVADRLESEAECEERLGDKHLGIRAMSDDEGDVNLTLTVGETPEDLLTIQLHDDQVSALVELPKIRQLVEVFVSPADFELPRTMEGSLGVEVRQDGGAVYTARFAAMEDINITPEVGQEKFSLHMSAAADPGSITFNGDDKTVNGALQIDPMDASLPWQIIVDMFYDDEPTTEWICETDSAGTETCREETTEPEEPPEVDEAFNLDVAGVHGAVAYAASDDAFVLTNLGLGDESTAFRVDDETIIQVDVNPDNGRAFDLTFEAPGEKDLGFIFSEDFAVKVQMNWERVSDVFEDLPDFLLDDAMGVRFAQSANPTLHILDVEDDTKVQMASGQITLWADSMAEDVVINEGECFVGTECADGEDCSDEEDEHDLFGGIEGGSCEE